MPSWSPKWCPIGVLKARTGSTEAQAGPAGQAGRPRRQSKGHRPFSNAGRPVRSECTRECMIYTPPRLRRKKACGQLIVECQRVHFLKTKLILANLGTENA